MNSGYCSKCLEILDLYPDFHPVLKSWFRTLQVKNVSLHASCGGRGHMEQEALFLRKATRAHYGESAHNFNAALDVFFMTDGKYDLDRVKFEFIIAPNLTQDLVWYGSPASKFYERPHIEIKGWMDLAKAGLIHLVE